MRYLVRTIAWSAERLANVALLKKTIPELEIFVDHVGDGYANFFAVCEAIHETGGVTLEDDVILCRNFKERIEAVIADKGPGEIIQFFEQPKVDWQTGYVWGGNFFSLLCTYFPPGLTRQFPEQFEQFKQDRPKMAGGMAYDRLIQYVLGKAGRKYWRIRPSLVQHHAFPSAISARARNRQTLFFVDDLEDRGEKVTI